MTPTALLRHVKAESDTPDRFATAHGFRSSFRDWASEHGYARDLAERALLHQLADNALDTLVVRLARWTHSLGKAMQKLPPRTRIASSTTSCSSSLER